MMTHFVAELCSDYDDDEEAKEVLAESDDQDNIEDTQYFMLASWTPH